MSRLALFQHLSRPLSERPVVVTPTRRLARALAAEFDAWQSSRGCAVWETPDVLPIAAFVTHLYEGAQYDPDLRAVRAPLTAVQEAALWEDVIRSSDVALASTAGAAALAAEAWTLAHRWQIADRLRHYAMTEDTRVFANWAAEFERRVEAVGAIEKARQPDAVRELVIAGRLSPPPAVLWVGFDEMPPQQGALLDALGTRGTQCERAALDSSAGRLARIEATDEREELACMADWVANRLAANPSARIAVVAQAVGKRRATIERALDAVLQPGMLLGSADRVRPYSVSLGPKLADAPLVATALRALRLVAGEVDFGEASALLRSRYLRLGDAGARDRFDLDCRCRLSRTVRLDQLIELARQRGGDSATIAQPLQALRAWRDEAGARPRRWSEWTSLLTEALRRVGFPGAEPLDSFEYQTLLRWQELMTEFAAIERVQRSVALRAAVERLGHLAATVVFQPEGGDPPVQVLGLLEAGGMSFDHLWIMGLTSEGWPPPVHAHPLLPIDLQRAKQMPGADVGAELVRARATLDRLTRSAAEVVASHARRDGDRTLEPSPMIAAWPLSPRAQPAARATDAIVPVELERIVDALAPSLSAETRLLGGTATLTDQAACPFRAFAAHRLAAEAPEEPHDGFDASERGQLVHYVLAQFWQALPDRSRRHLAAMSPAERIANLERAADQALARVRRQRVRSLSEALISIERRRLVGIVMRWLQFEIDERADFEVAAIEERRSMAIGPLLLNGRLDRVDRLLDGRTIVIDYKTGGAAGVRSWLGPRPDEPQLPLYLVSSEPDAAAIAFARVRAGEARFIALAREENLIPGARTDWRGKHSSWSALVDAWRSELTRLANAFAAGAADVAPKRAAQTCRHCGLALLCRLNERAAAVSMGLLTVEDSDER